MTPAPHIPVLLAEVLASVAPRDGDVVIDGTFGAGGYTSACLEAANCRVVAFDRDPTAIAAGQELAVRHGGRLDLIEAQFSTLLGELAARGISSVDAVMLDIGVSSMQIDRPERGFSFQSDGPLDMRMSGDGPTAADIVNTAEEATLADILFHLGDERHARRLARAIVHDRITRPFATTRDLAGLVVRVLKTPKIDGRHAATRTFQALRIAVNDELGELARALSAAEHVLRPGGRLVVVAFHSLEDGIVKRFLRARARREAQGSRHAPIETTRGAVVPSFARDLPKAVEPSAAEVARNSRARSARLRHAVRTDAPAWPLDLAALGVPAVTWPPASG